MKAKLAPQETTTNRWRSESMWLMTTSLVILASVALAFAIAYTRKVMIPFVLALFIVTIVSPMLDFMIFRLKIPRVLAVTFTLVVVIVVTTLVCVTLYQTGATIYSTLSDYNKEVKAMFVKGYEWIEKKRALFEGQNEEESEGSDSGESVDEVSNAVEQKEVNEVPVAEPEVFELTVTPESLAQGGAEANPFVPEEFGGGIQLPIANDGPLNVKPAPLQKTNTNKRTSWDLLDPNQLIAQVADSLGSILRGMVDVLLQLLSNVIFVIIFVIFMLSGRNPRSVVRGGVYAEIDQKIRRYIGTKVAISLITGLLVWFTLYKLGFEANLAGVFGIMAFLLNFIPSLGSIISTLLPIPIALALHSDPLMVVLVVLIPGTIQMVMGNVVEPKLMGEGLNLHPVTILLALSFWGTLVGCGGDVPGGSDDSHDSHRIDAVRYTQTCRAVTGR